MEELKNKSNSELQEIFEDIIMTIDRVRFNEVYYCGYAGGITISCIGDTTRGEFNNNIALKDEQWICVDFIF